MANRNWATDFKTLEHGLIELDGYIVTDNTGAITVSRTNGFTVTKTGTGAYQIVLADSYLGCVNIAYGLSYNGTFGNIQSVAGSQLPSTLDVNPVPTITFQTVTSAFAAANSTQPIGISFTLILKNTSVVP